MTQRVSSSGKRPTGVYGGGGTGRPPGFKAAGFFQEMTGKIEHQLERSPFLVGDRLTAADVTAVPLVNLATLSPEPGAPDSIQTFFANNFPIGDGRDHTRTWVKKVMEFA